MFIIYLRLLLFLRLLLLTTDVQALGAVSLFFSCSSFFALNSAQLVVPSVVCVFFLFDSPDEPYLSCSQVFFACENYIEIYLNQWEREKITQQIDQ